MLVWSWSQHASTDGTKSGYSGRPQGSGILVRMELLLFVSGRKGKIIYIWKLPKAITPQWEQLGNVNNRAGLRLQGCFDQVSTTSSKQQVNQSLSPIQQISGVWNS